MSVVYVVNRPVIRVNSAFKDKYDLSPAERFGRLVDVLPVGNTPRNPALMMRMVRDGLADFTPDDHLLAVGDPLAIAMGVLAASSRTGGPVSLLKFDRHTGEYGAHTVGP